MNEREIRDEIRDEENETTAVAKREPMVPVAYPTPLPEDVSPYAGAGTLTLDAKQIKLLTDELEIEDHDIKPTGEVFVPQVKYRAILNRVFGPGGWALVPMGEPQSKPAQYGNLLIVQKWHLTVQSKFISEVWGEMDYNPKNANTSEATAIEGAKSNALMRACKDLGIGAECWDKTFTTKYKTEHCVKVRAPNSRGEVKEIWRRKDRPPFPNEKPIAQ